MACSPRQRSSRSMVGSAGSIEVGGKNLDSIKTVTFDDDVPFLAQKDGTKLTIVLSREVTRKAGKAVVLLRPASGRPAGWGFLARHQRARIL